jgi:hypothetical protein
LLQAVKGPWQPSESNWELLKRVATAL